MKITVSDKKPYSLSCDCGNTIKVSDRAIDRLILRSAVYMEKNENAGLLTRKVKRFRVSMLENLQEEPEFHFKIECLNCNRSIEFCYN